MSSILHCFYELSRKGGFLEVKLSEPEARALVREYVERSPATGVDLGLSQSARQDALYAQRCCKVFGIDVRW